MPDPARWLADGHHDVPPGKIAAVVTWLEMHEPPRDLVVPAWPPETHLVRLGPGDVATYRALFREVGGAWLWFSRLRWNDETLRHLLADPDVEAYAMLCGPQRAGLVELDARTAGAVEIVFLGVVPACTGRGHGRRLLQFALARAWSRRPTRVWLHTCTLDHPAALGLYLRAGFRPWRRTVEVADDPRLTGDLPREAAPHMPVIGPERDAGH